MSRRRKLLYFVLVQVSLFALIEIGVRIQHAVGDRIPPTADRSLEREWAWVTAHQDGTPFDDAYVFDPQLGWRNAPDLHTDLVRTNSDGIRSDGEFAVGLAGGRRIAFVGDSYTFGPFVTGDESYVGRVEAGLGDWEVLNFGVNGYGTDQAVLTYEHRVREFAPSVVVMGYYARDYSRNLLTFSDYAKPRFVVAGDGLRLEGTPAPSPEALLDAYASGAKRIGRPFRSYAIDVLLRRLSRLDRHDTAAAAEGWQVLSRLMARFAGAVRADGAEPVWVIIPTRHVVSGSDGFEDLAARCRARAEALDMACLDLSTTLAGAAGEGGALYRPFDQGGHWTVRGNAVAAEAVVRFLREQGLAE